MFTLFTQHGRSMPSSIILCGTFRRISISQLWDNAHTLNLESCLLYWSSMISQFLDFVHCMFLLCDNAHIHWNYCNTYCHRFFFVFFSYTYLFLPNSGRIRRGHGGASDSLARVLLISLLDGFYASKDIRRTFQEAQGPTNDRSRPSNRLQKELPWLFIHFHHEEQARAELVWNRACVSK